MSLTQLCVWVFLFYLAAELVCFGYRIVTRFIDDKKFHMDAVEEYLLFPHFLASRGYDIPTSWTIFGYFVVVVIMTIWVAIFPTIVIAYIVGIGAWLAILNAREVRRRNRNASDVHLRNRNA